MVRRLWVIFVAGWIVAPVWGFDETKLKTVLIDAGFIRPVGMASPPRDRDRLFIVEQSGWIHIIKNGERLSPFLDLSERVLDYTEGMTSQGLFSIAFDPEFDDNQFFYVNYTRYPDGASIVARYSVSPDDPDVGDPESEVVLLLVPQPMHDHNGGQLAFGPDGYLYTCLGDGGTGLGCLSQEGSDLFGKMLRIDRDGEAPPTNPFVDRPWVRDEIWAFGLRNPWKFSFDAESGDLYIGDVGFDDMEEINFQPASSVGGENYGWAVMEGTLCVPDHNCIRSPPCGDATYTNPIYEYTHEVGHAVIGGFVYRGCGIPDLQGTYFFADYSYSKIFSFRYDGTTLSDYRDRTSELDPDGDINQIVAFGEDADRELYISTRSGSIYKIVAKDPPPAGTDIGYSKPGSDGLTPILDACGLLSGGYSAELRLRQAAPSRSAVLFVSPAMNPTEFRGGMLVPVPPTGIYFLTTSPEGTFEGTLPGGDPGIDIYTQFLIDDPGATEGYAFSNALELHFRL